MSSDKVKKILKARVWSIMQYSFNPRTGEDLHFNEDVIRNALLHKTIVSWCWVKHDKDVYSEADEANDETHTIVQGTPKPCHYHIVIKCVELVGLDTIAKWFNVPPQFCEPKSGKAQEFQNKSIFFDLAYYMTHKDAKQQAQGKHVYEFSDLHTSSDFDIERELRNIKSHTYIAFDGTPFRSDKEYYRYSVMYGGLSVKSIHDNNKDFYSDNFKDIRSWRNEYLNYLDTPPFLLNIYLCGNAGLAKDLLSRSLARLLVTGDLTPEDELPSDSSLYMEVGGNKVTYDKYDGQQAIIWSDVRSKTLIQRYHGFENVLSTFDVHPHDIVQHVKYGSIKLVNRYYIVNSNEPFRVFAERVSKGEDINQLYRRFPLYLNFTDDMNIELYYNVGFFSRSNDYSNYQVAVIKTNSLSRLAGVVGEHSYAFRSLLTEMCKEIKEKIDVAVSILTYHSFDVQELEDIIRTSFPGSLVWFEELKDKYGTGDELRSVLEFGHPKLDVDAVPDVTPVQRPEDTPDTGNSDNKEIDNNGS